MIPPSKAPTRELLRGRLREMVSELQAGTRLPSERDLAAEWGVARMTLRAAVDALVTEGLLERRHGAGTFVAFRPVLRMLGLTSFSQDMRSRGLVPIEPRPGVPQRSMPTPSLAERLQIPAGSLVFTITRLRLGSGEPMAIENVRIPVAYAPRLTAADLEGLALRGARVAVQDRGERGERRSSSPPSPTSDPALSSASTTTQACLRLRMVDADRTGRVVMLATCLYRGDKYQLRAEVTGNHAAIDRAQVAS